MKKLGKIVISPDKMMKNEELINLQGGYTGGGPYTVTCGPRYGGCMTQVSTCDDWTYLTYVCNITGCGGPTECYPS